MLGKGYIVNSCRRHPYRAFPVWSALENIRNEKSITEKKKISNIIFRYVRKGVHSEFMQN